MAQGGARVRSGPPPDPRALRRDRDAGDWIQLPAEGRDGDPPKWPLSRASKRELAMWDREWRRPQAVMWEANGQEIEVALYIRTLREAETVGAKAGVRTELRRQMDGLGLTSSGLLRNRWRIVTASSAAAPRPPAPSGRSVKDRLRLVAGGG